MAEHYHWFDGDKADVIAIDEAVAAAGSADDVEGELYHDNGNSGAAKAIDYANGPVQKITLTASNPTLTLSHFPAAGRVGRLRLLVKQDATGTRLLPTFAPVAVWGTPGAPTLTTTVNKTDVIDLFSIDGGVTIEAVVVVKGL